MSSLTAALWGFSHVFVVFAFALLFVILGALYEVREGHSERGKRVMSPKVFFVLAQIALLMGFILAATFGGGSRVGGVLKAFILNRWVIEDFTGSYISAMVLLLTFFALFYVQERLAKMQRIAEFYILLFFALLGIMLMCYSLHLVLIYVGLELMSLSLYAMLALDRDSPTAMEASMKYFVLGALSSGLLLFGMSLLFGATGSLYVKDYHQLITDGTANMPLLQMATIFILASLAFKFGLVPFHQWVPDIYQGASYPMAMMVANITKLGVFAIAMRLIITSLFAMGNHWKYILLIIALSSVVIGYLGAIVQTSFRRFLGYSSIANLGFMMLAMFASVEARQGMVGGNVFNAISADLFYLVVYQFTGVAAFAFAWVLAKDHQENDVMEVFKGLNQRYPFFALMMATLMLSMAGVPPFLGFWGKYLVINALITANHLGITVFAVLTTLIGAYYYLRVIKMMYFDEPIIGHQQPITLSIPFRFTLGMHCLLLLVTGLFPGWLIRLCYLIMA